MTQRAIKRQEILEGKEKKSPFTFKYTEPKITDKKMPAIFVLHGFRSNEEDLRPLVKSFEETHHIFSLRGPMVINPGEYTYHTITAFVCNYKIYSNIINK
jgi:predicted esterase